MLSAELGSALGGTLGQVGETLSAPRRAMWGLAAKLGQALGVGSGEAYESGADLLHGAFGVDRDSLLGQAGGMGIEMLTDPLSLIGGAIGRLGGRAASTIAGGADDAARMGGRLAKFAGPGLDDAASAATARMARSPAAMTPYLSDVGSSVATLGEGSSPLKALANARYLDDVASPGGANSIAARLRSAGPVGDDVDQFARFMSERAPMFDAVPAQMRQMHGSPGLGVQGINPRTAALNASIAEDQARVAAAEVAKNAMGGRLARMIGGGV